MTTVGTLTTRRFTVDELLRMDEAGVLGPDERVELIEGAIIEMSPIGSPHQQCVDRFNMVLAPACVGRAIVRLQGPVRLSDISLPQPDVALLAWRDDFYPDHPRAGDLLLVVEVADSTVATDRRIKVPLYARSGVVEAWLVDLPAGRIDVHRDPGPDGYRSVTTHTPGEALHPSALADVGLDVGWLLSR